MNRRESHHPLTTTSAALIFFVLLSTNEWINHHLSRGHGPIVASALPQSDSTWGNSFSRSKKGGIDGSSNSGASRETRRDLTSLHDVFPCETKALSSGGVVTDGTEAAAAAAGGTTAALKNANKDTAITNNNSNYLNQNSFCAMNNFMDDNTAAPPIQSSTVASAASSGAQSISYDATSTTTENGAAVTPLPFHIRGGAIMSANEEQLLDDDALDQMVDDLIAGLDSATTDGDVGQESSEDEETESGDEGEEEGNSEEVESDSEDQGSVVLAHTNEEDVTDREEISNTGGESHSSGKTQSTQQTTILSSQSPHTRQTISTSPRASTTSSINNLTPTTPTNAYYRFLVRRGPKGHILASFSLLSIQWLHIYLPTLYKFMASILLKCRIYDPKVLYTKERERQLAAQRKRQRDVTSFTDKIKNKLTGSSSKKSMKKAIQKQADEEATSKLQQLYKTMTMATSDLSEVRYRYLSVAFRKRHGLGKEYRSVVDGKKKKPMVFMGEKVGDGGVGVASLLLDQGEKEVVCSDDNEDEEGVGEGETTGESPGLKQTQQTNKGRRVKRKRISDWVVQAFTTNQRTPPSSSSKDVTASATLSKQPPIPASTLSLWKSVLERNAILEAAWEGRNAEKSVWENNSRDNSSGGGKRRGRNIKTAQTSSQQGSNVKVSDESYYGSASASKMFQSVITRVGTNGRILGAYPMDAPPIDKCASERGVLDYARRYGYGDWERGDDMLIYNEDEDDSEEDDGSDDSFGGLFVDGNDDVEDSVSPSSFDNPSTKARRRSRRKKQSRTKASSGAKTRRRSNKQNKPGAISSLGLSGGRSITNDSSLPRRRVTFEFGFASRSQGNRSQVSRPSVSADNSRSTNDLRAKLQERKDSSVLFVSDTRIMVPMQLLDKARKKLGQDEE